VPDSDGDSIPNSRDVCPFQPGYTSSGCPAAPGSGLCAPGFAFYIQWCPGQPAPVQHCGMIPLPEIYPPPPAACVWVHKGENSVYFQNETVYICYWVNQAMTISIYTQLPNGQYVTILEPSADDGRGDCRIGTASTPGTRATRIYTAQGHVLDTTIWNVQ
jgi:hypothetical protein